MTFLLFLLDVCFYNFTPFKTDFLLHSLLEKKENKFIFFFLLLWIDFVLNAHFRLFFLYVFLYFWNQWIKIPTEALKDLLFRFLFDYLLYKVGVWLLFQTFFFDFWGFLITTLYLCISHKL